LGARQTALARGSGDDDEELEGDLDPAGRLDGDVVGAAEASGAFDGARDGAFEPEVVGARVVDDGDGAADCGNMCWSDEEHSPNTQSSSTLQREPKRPAVDEALKHRELSGPTIPMYPARHASHVLGTVTHAARLSTAQSGAAVQLTAESEEEARLIAPSTASLLPDDSADDNAPFKYTVGFNVLLTVTSTGTVNGVAASQMSIACVVTSTVLLLESRPAGSADDAYDSNPAPRIPNDGTAVESASLYEKS